MKNTAIIIFLICCQNLSAQIPVDSLSYNSDLFSLEAFSEQHNQEIEDTQYDELLEQYINHPLNLNTNDRKELGQFPLFTELQINSLFEHRARFGDLIAIEELQVIEEFDPELIRKIKRFVTLNAGVRQIPINIYTLSQGKHSLIFRFQNTLETPSGYQAVLENEPHYPGSDAKFLLKYSYDLPGRIHAGIIGEKDPGESFFSGQQKYGFDFYSAHIMYKGKGLIRQALIGDYSIQSGQGLTCWSGLGLGKSSDIMSIKKNPRGIIPYSSTDENTFLRGIALSLGKKSWHSELFYSMHSIDGNLVNDDSTTKISSFQNSGYHRLPAEIADQHAVKEKVIGGIVTFSNQNFTTGVSVLITNFSKPIEKDFQPYRVFEFRGTHNINTGVHYSYLYRNICYFGEAARSENGAFALLQGLLVHLHPRISTSLLFRKYDSEYQALRSAGFSENTSLSNEKGFYWGMVLKLPKGITLNTYLDIFQFPWLKYQVDAPSSGHEYLIQVTWTRGKTFESYFRFRSQNKMENGIEQPVEKTNLLVSAERRNMRWNLRFKVNEWLECSSRIEISQWVKGNMDTENGCLFYQDLLIHPLKSRFSGSIRYAQFDCESYDARIYAYENDVLFSYSIPAYQGKGNRYYLNIRYRIRKGIDFWLRLARLSYDDKTSIGEGLDQINGQNKTEIKAQVRFQF